MGINKPYVRNCRTFIDGSHTESWKLKYVRHPTPMDAKNALGCIFPFLLLQKDFINLLDYIEPSNTNLKTYSFRIHELFVRSCIEIESFCRTILKENSYGREDKKEMRMDDYKKLEKSHMLSEYQIKPQRWEGDKSIYRPFESWKNEGSLDWYKAYHSVKHNPHNDFREANFKNLINAICGVAVLLSSQFYTEDFSSDRSILIEGNDIDDG